MDCEVDDVKPIREPLRKLLMGV